MKKFKDIKERFTNIREEIAQKNQLEKIGQETLDDIDLVNRLTNELLSVEADLAYLETERQVLLNKNTLTSSEAEKLALLNKIARQADDIINLIRDFYGDLKLDKKTILKHGDVKVMIDNMDSKGISVKDIFSSLNSRHVVIDLRDGGDKFNALGKLTLTDGEIESFKGEPFAVFLALKYCGIREEQKQILYKLIEEIEPKHSLWYFPILLSRLDLPEKLENKLVRKTQKFANDFETIVEQEVGEGDVASASGLRKGFFVTDVLSSPHLSKKSKKKLAFSLIKIGSALDCKYLLKKHKKYLDGKARKLALEKSKQLDDIQELTIKPFYEVNKKDLKDKDVHFVVHPFFGVGSMITRLDSNPKIAFQKYIIKEMNILIKGMERKRHGVISRFFSLLKRYSEYKRYQELADDPKAAIVFLLPNHFEFQKGLMKILSSFDSQGNVFYLETDTDNSGNLKEGDVNLIDNVLSKNIDINLSGGYIDACLHGGVLTLSRNPSGRRVVLDYSDSTMNLYFVDDYIKYLFKQRGVAIELKLPPAPIENIEDFERIVRDNGELQRLYEKFSYERAVKEEKLKKSTKGDLIIKHQS